MANGNKADDRDPKFGFGMRELREAQRARLVAPAETHGTAPASAGASMGFDPYNTSGSFDRRKNWERVGKR